MYVDVSALNEFEAGDGQIFYNVSEETAIDFGAPVENIVTSANSWFAAASASSLKAFRFTEDEVRVVFEHEAAPTQTIKAFDANKTGFELAVLSSEENVLEIFCESLK